MQEITVTTWNGKDSLTLKENCLELYWMNTERVVPLSQIISVEVKDPKSKLRPGMITIRVGDAPSTMVRLTSFMSVGDSGNIEFPHAYECLEDAHKIKDYIAHYAEKAQGAVASGTVVSVVEEIRGLKGLLDDGIITQEEFDAKKKQLLGL